MEKNSGLESSQSIDWNLIGKEGVSPRPKIDTPSKVYTTHRKKDPSMNEQQMNRHEHSERLIAAHTFLMRKPISHSKRVKKQLQQKLSRIDEKLDAHIQKLWSLLNRSMEP